MIVVPFSTTVALTITPSKSTSTRPSGSPWLSMCRRYTHTFSQSPGFHFCQDSSVTQCGKVTAPRVLSS